MSHDLLDLLTHVISMIPITWDSVKFSLNKKHQKSKIEPQMGFIPEMLSSSFNLPLVTTSPCDHNPTSHHFILLSLFIHSLFYTWNPPFSYSYSQLSSPFSSLQHFIMIIMISYLFVAHVTSICLSHISIPFRISNAALAPCTDP
jgi:hypothetical protein